MRKEAEVHLAFINLALRTKGLGKNTSGGEVDRPGVTSLVVCLYSPHAYYRHGQDAKWAGIYLWIYTRSGNK